MYQVAAAVRALGTRDVFDYIAMFAPLVLSVVAIGISISTAQKQNKITLFNLRYEAIHSLALVIAYAKLIARDDINIKMAQICFNANFDVDVDFSERNTAIRQMYAALRKVEKNVLVIEYLFTKETEAEIQQTFELFRNFMERLVENEVNEEWRSKFCSSCAEFEKGTYQELCRITKP